MSRLTQLLSDKPRRGKARCVTWLCDDTTSNEQLSSRYASTLPCETPLRPQDEMLKFSFRAVEFSTLMTALQKNPQVDFSDDVN